MRFSIQQNTIQGKRHENQDRMGYIYTREALLLVVCDGLGGHGNGEMAASWTLELIAQRFHRDAKPKIENPRAFLETTIIAAHVRILKKTLTEHLSTHPRTTVVCALIQNDQVWWAHAGDSRAYLVRRGQIVQRTKDHSKLQYLIDAGRMLPEEATKNHPDRSRLINCLGAEVFPNVEQTGPFPLFEKDIVFLSTDGVWGVLDEPDLLGMLAHADLSRGIPSLVNRASVLGGIYADDATALAVRWLAELPQKEGVDSGTLINEFESTVLLSMDDANDVRVMSDEEMDAKIAEINDALKRVEARQQ
jgi:PPM family protein phosphatase